MTEKVKFRCGKGDMAFFLDSVNPSLVKIRDKKLECNKEGGGWFPRFYVSGDAISLIRDDKTPGCGKPRLFYFHLHAFDPDEEITSNPIFFCKKGNLYLPESWVEEPVLKKVNEYFSKH